MKSVLRVYNMKTSYDINKVKNAVSKNQGVIACQINKESGEVSVIYDDYFLSIDSIIGAIENEGYTVI